MTDYRSLRLETGADGIVRLTLDRPDKHNALDATLIRELHDAARHLAADPAVRAVILAAHGKSFCAGGDLGWMRAQADQDRAGKIAGSRALAEMLHALDTLPKPLIARVQGPAYGGGVGMMAVCDIVVAVEEARFALTETRLGLIPANIGPYVVRRLGEGAARRVFMNARPFPARVARELGLVSEVVAAERLDDAVAAEAEAFLACAPGAVADAKALCLALARGEHDHDVLGWTAGRLADRWETGEAREGIRCFFARERPPWQAGGGGGA